MNLHYVFPGMIALAAHAVFVLGFTGKPAATLQRAVIELTHVDPFLVPDEPKEKPDPVDDSEPAAKKGTTEIAPPTSPEPVEVPVDRSFMSMMTPPAIDSPIKDPTRIIPGVLGVPEGDENGIAPSGRPVFQLSDLDKAPVTKFQQAPVYPFTAKRTGLTGEVVVSFTVDEHGRVLSPRIVSSSDRAFEEPSLAAVSKWRFEPGRRHGRPVRCRMNVPVLFTLNQ